MLGLLPEVCGVHRFAQQVTPGNVHEDEEEHEQQH